MTENSLELASRDAISRCQELTLTKQQLPTSDRINIADIPLMPIRTNIQQHLNDFL